MSTSLDTTFIRKCYTYKQIKRCADVCLYEYRYTETDRLLGYEVIRVYTDPKGTEYFPGSTLWGIKGWTYMHNQLEIAKKKFDKILSEPKKKSKRVGAAKGK